MVKTKIGKVNKYSNGLLASPDGGDYPFVTVPTLRDGAKDSVIQQENVPRLRELEKPRLSLLKIIRNYRPQISL